LEVVPSVILIAYWSAGRDEDGVQRKEPLPSGRPVVMVSKSFRLVWGPFSRKRDTGPAAPEYVMLNGFPTAMVA